MPAAGWPATGCTSSVGACANGCVTAFMRCGPAGVVATTISSAAAGPDGVLGVPGGAGKPARTAMVLAVMGFVAMTDAPAGRRTARPVLGLGLAPLTLCSKPGTHA